MCQALSQVPTGICHLILIATHVECLFVHACTGPCVYLSWALSVQALSGLKACVHTCTQTHFDT